MPRRPRGETGDTPYHVVNLAVRRDALFHNSSDYLAFENVLREALQRVPLRLLAYCAMPNHWHLVVWPGESRQLSIFMHWLTGTHARRWHACNGTTGTGPLYQDRFKAVPIESERQFLWACRYVERNPLRAGLVAAAQDWRWSSLWHRSNGHSASLLSKWPCEIPAHWLEFVNQPETAEELESFRRGGNNRRRGRPRKSDRGPA
jgi:putative transposase